MKWGAVKSDLNHKKDNLKVSTATTQDQSKCGCEHQMGSWDCGFDTSLVLVLV